MIIVLVSLSQQTIQLERFLAFEHVVDCSSKLDRQVGKRSRLATLLFDPINQCAGLGAAAFE